MKIKRIIGIVIVALIIIWVLKVIFKKDNYVGFYYSDASNLMNDIQSETTFDSLEACRDWINKQVSIYNPDNSNYDYECGKNCNLSGGKPYTCEETLE